MKSEFKTGFQVVQNLIKLKWVPEILESIANGNDRYSDILQSVPKISHTELQRKLNILIREDAIEKKKVGSSSIYVMKPYGEDLVHIFLHFANINKRHAMIVSQREKEKEKEKEKETQKEQK